MGRSPFLRAAAMAAAATFVVTACGDDDTTTTADEVVEDTTETTEIDETSTTTETTAPDADEEGQGTVIEVEVAGGEVQGGGRASVDLGDTVTIRVTSDMVDEVHVHGYDVYADIGPTGPTDVVVEATVPGVWEVELHDSGIVLLELQVS